MSGSSRQRAFVFTAVAIGAVAWALALWRASDPAYLRAPAARQHPAVVVTDGVDRSTAVARSRDVPGNGPARGRDRLRDVARKFASHLLRFQAGTATPAVVRWLSAHTDARLGRWLLDQPARPVGRVRARAGRVVGVSLYRSGGETVKASARVNYRRGQPPSLLEFVVAPKAGHWQVVRLLGEGS